MANKRKMTTNEYVRSLPPKDPKDIAVSILIKENRKLKERISKLEQQLLTSQNDADANRAMANIPQY